VGIYSEYLDTLHDFPSIVAERKKQLSRIAQIRGRAVLTIASDLGMSPQKAMAPVGIDYTDLLPVADQLDNVSGAGIDVIIETPGGFAERAEDIVKMIRNKFDDVAFIVPGAAMSAGTIMVMSGNEILLDPNSSLGPIDAQVSDGAKRFSADAFLKGLEKIKEEVDSTGNLNKAYIPILAGISLGQIQAYQNAQEFSQRLVSEWLAKWKFQKWTNHATTGAPVTEVEKRERAGQVAAELCDHSRWLTHNGSIKLPDLLGIGLKVTDYSGDTKLHDAIRRYHALLRMGFESTSIYKLFETPTSQVHRFLVIPGAVPPPAPAGAPDMAQVEVKCPKCQHGTRLQANLGKKQPLQQGSAPFPADNKLRCPNCNLEIDVSNIRKQLEAQSKKPIVS